MNPSTLYHLRAWVACVTSELSILGNAAGHPVPVKDLQQVSELLRDAIDVEIQATEPGHISDAEAVQCQAARIRDLVSENVMQRRQLERYAELLREADQAIRNAVADDPGACLSAHSMEASLLELADKITNELGGK